MKNHKISSLSKIILFASTIFTIVTIFVSIWRIELVASQYLDDLRMRRQKITRLWRLGKKNKKSETAYIAGKATAFDYWKPCHRQP